MILYSKQGFFVSFFLMLFLGDQGYLKAVDTEGPGFETERPEIGCKTIQGEKTAVTLLESCSETVK